MSKGLGIEREEAIALFVLMALNGVGPRALWYLLNRHGSARGVMAADWKDVRRIHLRRSHLLPGPDRRGAQELLQDAHVALKLAERFRMSIRPWGHPDYPRCVAEIPDPPGVLFLRGNIALAQRPGIAIVGSRRATERGRDVTDRLASAIAATDHPVVSGLALGIDAAAHKGALRVRGPTTAVLGCGTDIAYPRSNLGIYRDIIARGLLVSEFAPGVGAAPHHFPLRNRVISALAEVVVVVEAAARSGVRHTVDHALDQGKDVYVVPGSANDPACAGSMAFLEQGALPLDSIGRFVELHCVPTEVPTAPSATMPPEQSALLDRLTSEPATLDQVVSGTNLGVGRALGILSVLEIDGWVEHCSGARYRLAVPRTVANARPTADALLGVARPAEVRPARVVEPG